MMSHDLAKLLLSKPNLPVATHANNHHYCSESDRRSHGRLNIGIVRVDDFLRHRVVDHLMIGNFRDRSFGSSNIELKEHFVISEKKDESVEKN